MKTRKLFALALALIISAPCAFAAPLQGGVEETGILPSEATKNEEIMDMPTPVLPSVPKKPLQGTIKQDALHGEADEDDPNLQNQNAEADSDGRTPLRGQAQSDQQPLDSDDPDMDDQELQVAWDRWRNNLLYAIQSGVQEALNNPEDAMLRWDPVRKRVLMRFPLGTTSWFYCKVNSNRHIESLKIMEPSGFDGYDKAVLKAVRDLEGSSLLKFPKRSRRLFVTQSAGIKTSDQGGGRQDFRFGDVERYRTGN